MKNVSLEHLYATLKKIKKIVVFFVITKEMHTDDKNPNIIGMSKLESEGLP